MELPLFNSTPPEGWLVAGNSPWLGGISKWKLARLQTRSGVTGPASRLCPTHPYCVLPRPLMRSLLGLMTRTRTDTGNKEELLLCDFPRCPLGESAGDHSQKEEGEGGGREGAREGEICFKCPILIPLNSFFFFFNNQGGICVFIYGCSGSLLLHKGSLLVRASFLWLRPEGATLHCGAQASHCGGLSCSRAPALGTRASVVEVGGLSCPLAYGIFPDQGLYPCPLRWQAEA